MLIAEKNIGRRKLVISMNNLDIAGILSTYALKAQKARNTKHLRDIVRDLKSELDLRSVRMTERNYRDCIL